MKTTLSIEESARLVELGVDAKLASISKYLYDKNTSQHYKVFIFTLSDLLSILPKEINRSCLTIVSIEKKSFAFYGSWEKEYIHSLEETCTPYGDCIRFSAPELIDALNSLLIWTIEQGYLKTEKI